jgi:hypothetical protein
VEASVTSPEVRGMLVRGSNWPGNRPFWAPGEVVET